MDLSSLLSSSNDSFPYFYFILLSSTVFSVGVSFARILTNGKNPFIKNIVSFKFFKVILMLILKLLVQCYILSMAVKSIMFKFVSKERKTYKIHTKSQHILLSLVPIFSTSFTWHWGKLVQRTMLTLELWFSQRCDKLLLHWRKSFKLYWSNCLCPAYTYIYTISSYNDIYHIYKY